MIELTDDDLHDRHLSMAVSTQAGAGSFADLLAYAGACAEADGLRAEVRRRELAGSFCPDVAAPAPAAGPLRGLRSAAAVLGIGRNTLAMRIGAMPAHQQPARLGARGVVWWASAEACRAWWADLHSVAAPAPRTRKRKSRVTTTDTRPLRERLAQYL